MLPPFDLNVADPVTTRYRRTHNTPVRETEERLNKLYGAWRTILCNSGLEAVSSVLALIKPKTVIVDDQTYFETRHYIQYLGIKMVQIPDLNNTSLLAIRLKSAEKPVLVIGDSPSTFAKWLDIRKIRRITKRYGAYLMVDNSHVSLYYENPIAKGADICVESYTKYVCGHGDTFAGGIALSESMKWLDDREVPVPIPGIKGIDWVLSRRGNVANPHSAYMVARGLETLPVRMKRHTENATYIYNALKDMGVPALYSGCGGLITLPGITADFCVHLKKFVTIGTFGCTYSNTDYFRSDAAYKKGVCARLSVGLEDPEVLLEDVKRAWKEVTCI